MSEGTVIIGLERAKEITAQGVTFAKPKVDLDKLRGRKDGGTAEHAHHSPHPAGAADQKHAA